MLGRDCGDGLDDGQAPVPWELPTWALAQPRHPRWPPSMGGTAPVTSRIGACGAPDLVDCILRKAKVFRSASVFACGGASWETVYHVRLLGW